jgi:hypothetical protein
MENISNNNEATVDIAVVEETAEKTDSVTVATIDKNDVAAITENEAANAKADATTLVPPTNSEESCNTDCGYQLGGIITTVVLVIFVLWLVIRSKKHSVSKGKKKSFKTNPNAVEIYVGNLSYEMSNSDLRKEFQKFGIVNSARIITQRNSRKSKGYGFVEMKHRSEAEEAIIALNNKEIKGRKIHVNEARANTRHGAH